MATTTRVLTASVNGTVYTTNANGALEAIDTCHSGATAPTDELANGKLWLDTSTTPGILKIYNNSVWVAVDTTLTAGEILTAIKTVDGAGSGLDADLLDGNSAAAFYLATNPSGYTTNVGTITGVTAGGGITGGGTSGTVTISHTDTSTQASVNNSGSVYIQDITLDAYGHVTAIASTTVPASPPTTAEVGSATAGLAVGSVGSYAYLQHVTANLKFDAGVTYAGSSLRYSGTLSSSGTTNNGHYMFTGSTAASGTWRAMGAAQDYFSTKYPATLFLRIS